MTSEPECLFFRISQREIAAHLIYETSASSPSWTAARSGPVTPRSTARRFTLHDAPADLLAAVVTVGQKLARAMKRTSSSTRMLFCSPAATSPTCTPTRSIHEETDITSRRYIVEEPLTFRCLPVASDRELARTAADCAGRCGRPARLSRNEMNSNKMTS